MAQTTDEMETALQPLSDKTQSALSVEPVYDLPDQPVVLIEARRRWAPLDLRGLWAYRELLYFLIWRDVKVRYKQTLLGAAWAIIQPLVLMIIRIIGSGNACVACHVLPNGDADSGISGGRSAW